MISGYSRISVETFVEISDEGMDIVSVRIRFDYANYLIYTDHEGNYTLSCFASKDGDECFDHKDDEFKDAVNIARIAAKNMIKERKRNSKDK